MLSQLQTVTDLPLASSPRSCALIHTFVLCYEGYGWYGSGRAIGNSNTVLSLTATCITSFELSLAKRLEPVIEKPPLEAASTIEAQESSTQRAPEPLLPSPLKIVKATALFIREIDCLVKADEPPHRFLIQQCNRDYERFHVEIRNTAPRFVVTGKDDASHLSAMRYYAGLAQRIHSHTPTYPINHDQTPSEQPLDSFVASGALENNDQLPSDEAPASANPPNKETNKERRRRKVLERLAEVKAAADSSTCSPAGDVDSRQSINAPLPESQGTPIIGKA